MAKPKQYIRLELDNGKRIGRLFNKMIFIADQIKRILQKGKLKGGEKQ